MVKVGGSRSGEGSRLGVKVWGSRSGSKLWSRLEVKVGVMIGGHKVGGSRSGVRRSRSGGSRSGGWGQMISRV